MGQKDLAQNDYFADNNRFADICNGILFDGEVVIQADELQETDADIVYHETKGRRKIIPDKIRLWKGTYLSVITLENQSLVDYSMVFRAMKIEAISYEKQWKQREKLRRKEGTLQSKQQLCWCGKGETFTPVITVVIYFGTDKEWDGATSLYEMLEIHPKIKKYISNYKMNLFDYRYCKDLSVFQTDVRELFGILKCANDENQMSRYLVENHERLERLDSDSVDLICDIAGIQQNEREKIMNSQDEKEGNIMCKAFDDHYESGRREGIKEATFVVRLESIKNIIEAIGKTVEEAMDILKIPENEREVYLEKL